MAGHILDGVGGLYELTSWYGRRHATRHRHSTAS